MKYITTSDRGKCAVKLETVKVSPKSYLLSGGGTYVVVGNKTSVAQNVRSRLLNQKLILTCLVLVLYVASGNIITE